MAEAGWSHYEHQADVGIRAHGPTLEEALVQAALGLTAVITEPEAVAAREAVPIAVSAPDPELLLVEWLDALVYAMATRRMLFGRFEIAIREGRLEGTAWGEPLDRARHRPAVEVKGTTLTDLRVRQEEDGTWTARCIVDV